MTLSQQNGKLDCGWGHRVLEVCDELWLCGRQGQFRHGP